MLDYVGDCLDSVEHTRAHTKLVEMSFALLGVVSIRSVSKMQGEATYKSLNRTPQLGIRMTEG